MRRERTCSSTWAMGLTNVRAQESKDVVNMAVPGGSQGYNWRSSEDHMIAKIKLVPNACTIFPVPNLFFSYENRIQESYITWHEVHEVV